MGTNINALWKRLSESERKEMLVKALGYIEQSTRLPFEVFKALMKARPASAFELVTVREETPGKLEVLLTQRPPNDPYFPSQWHTPGSNVGNRERAQGVFGRLAKSDETGIAASAKPVFAGVVSIWKERRGHAVCMVWVQKVTKLIGVGKWFGTEELDRIDVIGSHRKAIIPMALSVLQGNQPYFCEYPDEEEEED